MICLIGIAGGRLVNDREWHDVYVRGEAEVGEDLGCVTDEHGKQNTEIGAPTRSVYRLGVAFDSRPTVLMVRTEYFGTAPVADDLSTYRMADSGGFGVSW